MGFWMTDRWVTMPVLGLIAREAKNMESGSLDGWMAAEEKLCSTYKPYFAHIGEDRFNQAKEYMTCTFDLGRSPMSLPYKIFLFALVVAEAYGFSLMLAGTINQEASQHLIERIGLAVVFAIASLLAISMHNAGDERYRTNLIRSCYKKYRELGQRDYVSNMVSLSDDQTADRADPPYLRCLNRVVHKPHDMGQYLWLMIAAGLVAAVLVGSSVLRYEKLQEAHDREVKIQQTDDADPFATVKAPKVLTGPGHDANQNVDGQLWGHQLFEGVAGITLLGVVFIVTQAVGFMGGYQHSFAGRETYHKAHGANSSWFWRRMDGAYVISGGFATYRSYHDIFQPMKDIVNSRLKVLQDLLKKNSHRNLKLDHTFHDYLRIQYEIEAREAALQFRSAQPPITPRATQDDVRRKFEQVPQEQWKSLFASLDDTEKDLIRPWLVAQREVRAASEAEARKRAESEAKKSADASLFD